MKTNNWNGCYCKHWQHNIKFEKVKFLGDYNKCNIKYVFLDKRNILKYDKERP